jgi:membrane-associated protein
MLFLLLAVAAIAGDTVNYWIGRYIGPRALHGLRFVKKEYIDRTHTFYERHGGKTIVIARFMPIVRTFAPFVAGIGTMQYARFLAYNIAGGVLWIALFVFAGYYFGNIPAVERNFTLVILGIIFVSILPGVIEYARQRMRAGSPARS